MKQSNIAMLALMAPPLIFFGETLTFLAFPMAIPENALRFLYPQLKIFSDYCANNKCLFPADLVSTVYVVQLITFMILCVLFYFVGRKNQYKLDSSVISWCGVVIFGCLMDYALGNFSFRQIFVAPNSVATSPVGLFRYALLFSIASICAATLTNIVKKASPYENSR